MQIHYIWIYDFNNIKKTGINLSSRFIFEIRHQETTDGLQSFDLQIRFNPDYIPDFFEEKRIAEVSAIIGKNGSGKSSILKYIKSRLPEGMGNVTDNDIFIYSLENNGKEELFVSSSTIATLNFENNTGLPFQSVPHPDPFLHGSHRSSRLSDADYIYYSHSLDYNDFSVDWRGLIDISTNALLMEERKRILGENQPDGLKGSLLQKTSDLENLHIAEVARAVEFLDAEIPLPFNRPDALQVKINLDDIAYFTMDATTEFKPVANLLRNLEARRRPDEEEDSIVGGFLHNFSLAILVNFLLDERKYSMNRPYLHTLELLKDESPQDYIIRFFSTMKGIELSYDEHPVNIPRLEELSSLVPAFTAFIKKLLSEDILKISDPFTGQLLLKKLTDQDFKSFRTYYLQVKGISTFLAFTWRSLSSGEQSYLSFMARFYHVRHHSNQNLKPNLIILIDEGDACYHPEWQRRFFNTTIGFLNNLFDKQKMHLIFTANTPFLSSDLPKANVLFIEKKDQNTSVFHSKDNNRTDTFAANIHSLFSNSFYMDGILIGAYAKNRLDKIIRYLNNPEEQGRNETYKRIIDMIGEPVLRKKLQDMWFEKFGMDEELLQLARRMEEIKERQSKNKSK